MQRRAFTVVEILLAVSIVAVIGSVSIPSYRYFQIVSDLDRASDQVTHALYRSRHLAMTNADDSTWGFRVSDGVLFHGANFAERDVLFDEDYALPIGVAASGLPEVTFSRIRGVPSATGSIVLTATNGLQRVIAVMNEGGVIVKDPDGDMLTICHFSGTKGQQLKVAESAWPAHRQQHGDMLGPCPPVE